MYQEVTAMSALMTLLTRKKTRVRYRRKEAAELLLISIAARWQ